MLRCETALSPAFPHIDPIAAAGSECCAEGAPNSALLVVPRLAHGSTDSETSDSASSFDRLPVRLCVSSESGGVVMPNVPGCLWMPLL